MKMPVYAYVFVLKPLIVGLVPSKLLLKFKQIFK